MKIIKFGKKIYIASHSSVGGIEEGRGPLGKNFDFISTDDTFSQKTWELAEGEMCRTAVNLALSKQNLSHEALSFLVGGDLQNQCVASSLGTASFGVPFFGLYGACSTATESLALLSCILNSTEGDTLGCAVTSSHNSAAERQFRTPVEYGAQRNKSAQWTATAAGAFLLSSAFYENKAIVCEAMAGRVIDGATKDAANMGAAMAFSAADTIVSYFSLSELKPADFDFIVTGDLGYTGSSILRDILSEKLPSAVSRHIDCGTLLYDKEIQDIHSGASGCGTSASVLSSHFLPLLERREISRILLLSTGALMSPTSVLQGQNIFGTAPLVHICAPS